MVAGEFGQEYELSPNSSECTIFPSIVRQTELSAAWNPGADVCINRAWLKGRKWFPNVQSEEENPPFLFFSFLHSLIP